MELQCRRLQCGWLVDLQRLDELKLRSLSLFYLLRGVFLGGVLFEWGGGERRERGRVGVVWVFRVSKIFKVSVCQILGMYLTIPPLEMLLCIKELPKRTKLVHSTISPVGTILHSKYYTCTSILNGVNVVWVTITEWFLAENHGLL